jgi:hypothetical protein
MSRPVGSKNKSTKAMQSQVEELPLGNTNETDADIRLRLNKTFRVFEKMTNGMIQGNIRSCIVTGATGCGKSWIVDQNTEEARDANLIELRVLQGASSALGIYKELWYANQGPSDKVKILKVDDCDIYHDLEAINVLKIALDTKQNRRISWNKESYPLINNNIPLEFNFEGACIFLSNKNFVREISYGGKMADHYKAFLGRSIFLDLGIHSKREILIRIKQVVDIGDFYDMHSIEAKDGATMLTWCTDNLDKIREISFRTMLQLHQMMNMGSDWEEMAEVTLFKRS